LDGGAYHIKYDEIYIQFVSFRQGLGRVSSRHATWLAGTIDLVNGASENVPVQRFRSAVALTQVMKWLAPCIPKKAGLTGYACFEVG
jgi:hypothetical protein